MANFFFSTVIAVIAAPNKVTIFLFLFLRLLFWTDSGKHCIERANMDGTNRMVLTDVNALRVHALTIDYTLRTLYWADAYLDYIGSMSYDGENRRQIVGRPHIAQPFAITVFNNHLFFTDWIRHAVVKVDKFTGKQNTMLLKDLIKPMDIKVYHKTCQPTTVNPCVNCGCQQICLISAQQTCTCKCEIGFQLDSNNKSCVKINDFLLYTQPHNILGTPLTSKISSSPMLSIEGIDSPPAVDFDYAEGFIYYNSIKRPGSINRVSLKGNTNPQLVIQTYSSFRGIAVDWLGRNIYWADTSLQEISVSNLNGSFKKTLFYKEVISPREIVLHPKRG